MTRFKVTFRYQQYVEQSVVLEAATAQEALLLAEALEDDDEFETITGDAVDGSDETEVTELPDVAEIAA